MSKHTPGPWAWNESFFGLQGATGPVLYYEGYAGMCLALEREEANARLIAAAPDMLEALLFAERHCPCGARPESPDTHPHVPGCVIAAAIKKARGET
jgi:hypothetical protein